MAMGTSSYLKPSQKPRASPKKVVFSGGQKRPHKYTKLWPVLDEDAGMWLDLSTASPGSLQGTHRILRGLRIIDFLWSG